MADDKQKDAVKQAKEAREAGEKRVEKERKEAQAEEVQERREQELEQGHVGEKYDPFGNEAYSLESGPDSPSAFDATLAASRRQADALAESVTEGTVTGAKEESGSKRGS